jgi:hypothetical protein
MAFTSRKISNRVLHFHYLEVWFVAQRVDFSPVHWDTTPCLNKAQLCGCPRSAWVVDENHLLCFVEVGNMAILVYATSKVSSTSSVPRTTADQADLHAVIVHNAFSEIDG